MANKIEIHDQSVSQVIIDLANNLGVEHETSHNECCLRLPEKFGSGYIKSYEFDFGVGVLEIDCLFKKDFRLDFEKQIVHPLKMIFNRESSFYHKFEDNVKFQEIRRLENAMVSSTQHNNHVFKIASNTPMCIFCIEINRKKFEEKIESFLPEMNEDLIDLFRDVNGVNKFYHKSYYSLEISKFISEYTDCEDTGFMRKVYLEGKTYEILTHQLRQYLDDLNEPIKRLILRKATIESIEQAISIIKDEIENMDNVVSLAKRVGLNQNTLQNGFKQLYKTSVNEYIRNFRIEKAKDLMETTDLNITQITYRIGINSRSYFSKLFKKRFKVTPKQYIDKTRNKKRRTKSA